MQTSLLVILVFFWVLLLFYSLVTIGGLWHRLRFKGHPPLKQYPSVAVLIPAHNEGVVMEDTMRAMARLQYPGTLNIYLLDDQSSDDTGEIVQSFAEVFSHIHYIKVPPGSPKGKSRVLNYGLSISESDYFIVYDADNQPESDALLHLVHTAEQTPNAAGAVGYVKTQNVSKNWLTRMIGLEFQVFQLLMQCGRWAMFKLGSLAGTNMLLRRSVLEEMGGYDVYALAEDAELTVRITAAGYLLPVVPQARTWEQEPETLKIFIKQRTRWLTGNLYLLEKSLRDFSHWKGKTFILSLQHLLTYFLFVFLLLISDVFFVMGIFGYELPSIQAPLLLLWFMSYAVYTAQLLSAIVIDGNVTVRNVFYVLIMYFTYAQIFIILLIRSSYSYISSRIRKKTIAWDKTQRFKGEAQ
ncbi:glycosyl transferase family 2 protein [Fictibacillus macauensis ZFHKF-1]|uniref:Glycosyl transferase family 2 protein n=1 Tax=Fictibacillus macauensis ZFHKF-1 TaxID=1196324 RepID=I8AED7_9BACL|nr:glycosyltransferase [Fictibacillus macauensis]EIT83684.1 glycosyl transferase family 2 protein [Fictibacillus macauensis ZFHKF-1]